MKDLHTPYHNVDRSSSGSTIADIIEAIQELQVIEQQRIDQREAFKSITDTKLIHETNYSLDELRQKHQKMMEALHGNSTNYSPSSVFFLDWLTKNQ